MKNSEATRAIRLFLPFALGYFLAAGQASCSTYTFPFTITFISGPETGETGTGLVSYDTSLIAHVPEGGFIYAAPNELGLLSLQINVLGIRLSLSDFIDAPRQPVLYLDDSLAPQGLWGAWGSTTATDAPAILLSGSGNASVSFFFESATHSIEVNGPNELGEVGWGQRPGPGNQQSNAVIVYGPEPSPRSCCVFALMLFGGGMLVRRR